MMTTISPADMGGSATTRQVQTTSSSSGITSDFDTFLSMLTAQARYQDPLEPVESTEYASQLAQFSAVEQQVQTNDLLNSMMEQLSATNLSEFSQWIGMQARSPAATYFDGTPITIAPEPASGTDEMNLLIYDAQKDEVGRLPLSVSNETYEWDGRDGYGNTLPQGNYTFVLETKIAGDVTDQISTDSYTTINEVRNVSGETVFVMAGGGQVQPSEITAFRRSSTP
jgi:flagellar basal-body rod modification protein FlgD